MKFTLPTKLTGIKELQTTAHTNNYIKNTLQKEKGFTKRNTNCQETNINPKLITRETSTSFNVEINK